MNLGTGMVVLGLASLIIGQSVISRGKSGILRGVVAVVVGSLIYRAIYAVALKFNVTTYLKLITAVIVALAIAAPALKDYFLAPAPQAGGAVGEEAGRMLKLSGVSKTFNPGTVNEKKALTDVDLRLERGDFITIVGSNGAGKSTLFNAISGVFFADAGSIVLDGEDITFQPEYRRSREIGRLFQDPMKGTAPHMTIEEDLALAYLRAVKHQRAFFSRVNKEDKAFFREQLSLLGMGLEDRMRQPVGLLSGGQRQALTLLMATMVPPKLLLLDEHTAALDPGTAEKVLALTKDIVARQNITCLMVTHNMKNALELGNRTLMMDAGRIVLDIGGEERKGLTVEDLLSRFRAGAGKDLDNDRILLS